MFECVLCSLKNLTAAYPNYLLANKIQNVLKPNLVGDINMCIYIQIYVHESVAPKYTWHQI